MIQFSTIVTLAPLPSIYIHDSAGPLISYTLQAPRPGPAETGQMPTRHADAPAPVDTVTRDAPRGERQGKKGEESGKKWDLVGRCRGVDVWHQLAIPIPHYHGYRGGGRAGVELPVNSVTTYFAGSNAVILLLPTGLLAAKQSRLQTLTHPWRRHSRDWNFYKFPPNR